MGEGRKGTGDTMEKATLHRVQKSRGVEVEARETWGNPERGDLLEK